MQRILLFLMTNIAILVVVSFVFNIISANTGLTVQNPLGLLILCGLFGFGGAFVSLFISRWMAVRATGAQVIEQPRTPAERWLVETVKQLLSIEMFMASCYMINNNSPLTRDSLSTRLHKFLKPLLWC